MCGKAPHDCGMIDSLLEFVVQYKDRSACALAALCVMGLALHGSGGNVCSPQHVRHPAGVQGAVQGQVSSAIHSDCLVHI
jgi:hypothetical protein